MYRKGIILAGGKGTRLFPLTKVISKQLLPIYDKPMIYYPLATLMLANIREILIISTSRDKENFKQLLGDGSALGISIEYKVQDIPEGIAQAFLIGESFLNNSNSALILGDNLFHGNEEMVAKVSASREKGAHIFAYPVHDPQRYGVVSFNRNGKVTDIKEKPSRPDSKFAITGLYFYDDSVVERAKTIVPSKRGELEITDINQIYLKEKNMSIHNLGRGFTWFDTGSPDSLLNAANFIKSIQDREPHKISCIEEICYKKKFTNKENLKKYLKTIPNSNYKDYINNIL